MKKILLLLFFMLVPKVEALTYSDYSDFSKFTDEPIQKSELVDVITEKRYQYYKLNKILGPYLPDGDNEYEYIDYNDFILGEESQLLLEKPDDTNRVINTVYGYEYKRVKPVNYIEIQLYNNDNVTLTDLKIFDGNKQIKSFAAYNYLSDYEPSQSSVTFNKNGLMKILFTDEYYLDNLKINFNFSNNDIKYSIKTGYDDDIYTSYNFIYNINESFEFQFKNSNLVNPSFEYVYDVIKEETNVFKINSDLLTFYTYQDKYYLHYNLEKIYNDEYTKEPVEDYIYKDDDLYKVYYAYRTRSIINDLKENISNNLFNDLTFKNNKTNKENIVNNLSSNNLENNTQFETKEELSEEIPLYHSSLKTMDYKKIKPVNKDTSNNFLYLIYFIIFLTLSIIILVLSKRYKSKFKYAKV